MRTVALSLLLPVLGCLGPCRPVAETLPAAPGVEVPARAIRDTTSFEVPAPGVEDSEIDEAPAPVPAGPKKAKRKKKRRPPAPRPAPPPPPAQPAPEADPDGAAPPPAPDGGEDDEGIVEDPRKQPKPAPPGIHQVDVHSWTVTRQLVERWKENPYALGDAEEHPDGWKLERIRRRHAYHLGMRSKDVVTSVNGRKLATKAQLLAAYMFLKGKSEFDVEFERDGVPLTHHYRVLEAR